MSDMREAFEKWRDDVVLRGKKDFTDMDWHLCWLGWQAARAQGDAEAARVTSEMKAECMGEFSWQEEAPYYDEDGDIHDYVATHVVPWDICKQIYKRMASCAPRPPKTQAVPGWMIEVSGNLATQDNRITRDSVVGKLRGRGGR